MNTIDVMPTFLYHYFEKAIGPFVNLSDLPLSEAEEVQDKIRRDSRGFASKRSRDYLLIRRELEDKVRQMFFAKGGRPVRQRPHYMTLGRCLWLQEWYIEGRELCIPLSIFAPESVSFTYGDTFPAMRCNDGKPYRGMVYTVDEISDIIRKYGLPQNWNRDGHLGPERYIEAQIWDDAPIRQFMSSRELRNRNSKSSPCIH